MSKTPNLAPTATVNIGGQDRTLRFDFNALALLEEKTGKSAFDQATFQNVKASDLRALIWAGILHELPDVKMEEVGSWLHPGNVREVSEAIGKAFGNDVKEKEAAPLPEADQLSPHPSENE